MYHSLIQVLSAAKLIGRLSGATIDEIEDKLGISRRSVYRVLETLEDLGYPYYKDEEHGNRYRLVDAGKPTQWWMPLPSVSFDLEDRVLLDYLFDSAARDPAIASGVRAVREKMSFIGASAGYALAPKESGAGPLTETVRLLSASSTIKASGRPPNLWRPKLSHSFSDARWRDRAIMRMNPDPIVVRFDVLEYRKLDRLSRCLAI